MKRITLSLMTLIISALLLIGCGGGGGGSSGGSSSPEPLSNTTADGDGDGNNGGGGDGNNGGGGGNGNGSNGDGGGERPSFPAEVELSISPFIDGLRIQWHNLSAIEGAGGIYIHLNLTGGNPPQPDERKIAIEDFSDDSYEIDGLDNGTAYRLVGVRVEQANNTFWVIDNITWSEPWEAKTNALDNNGGGIVVGVNHDGDGRADSEDEDDDNDGRPDTMDPCRLSEVGGSSTNRTLDYDEDGCRNDEDTDGDNDGILNKDEVDSSCVLDEDCDDDGVDDGNEAMGCVESPDCDSDGDRDDVDIDGDGDGLIEVGNAEELNAVRWVLNGTGFKADETAILDQTGCGNGRDVMECSGYELVRDISLADFIARTSPTAGWQPIAHDIDIFNNICDGEDASVQIFTGIFNGNGFEVSGLFINRSRQDCVGLFGQARGIILNLGVVASRVIGDNNVGGLVGWSDSIKILQSYVVSHELRGDGSIGGLLGKGLSPRLMPIPTEIVQSYVVAGEVRGNKFVGGLVGDGQTSEIVQSYAVVGTVREGSWVGGLVGWSGTSEIIQSYGVSGEVSGTSNVGGLVGQGGNVQTSYWDNQTSGRNNDGTTGSVGQTTSALRSPTDYTGIYDSWDDAAINEGTTIAGIDHNGTIWCDENHNGRIGMGEMRDAGHPRGDNRVWDFGTASDYPALRCTGDSLEDQRAWWYLNAINKPQLNQTYLDAYLDGSLP